MSAINLHLGGIFQLWHCMEFQQQLHKALVSRHCGRGQGRGAWSGSQKWRGDGFEGMIYGDFMDLKDDFMDLNGEIMNFHGCDVKCGVFIFSGSFHGF